MIPLLIILVLAILYFLYAMKLGAIGLLSSALGLAAAMAAFFYGANMGPVLLVEKWGMDALTWEFILVGSGVMAILAYFIVWGISSAILRFLFNPDSPLNPLARGIPGGILSLFSALVVGILILNVTRITGSFFELQRMAAIAQPEIVESDLDQLPEPSQFTQWRDSFENLVPDTVIDLMDFYDPFSRRESRNLGILTLFAKTEPAREFSEGSSQMATLLSNRKINDHLEGDSMVNMLKINDRVGLVLSNDSRKTANHPETKNRLKNIDFDIHLDEFVQYLKTNKTPDYPKTDQDLDQE